MSLPIDEDNKEVRIITVDRKEERFNDRNIIVWHIILYTVLILLL